MGRSPTASRSWCCRGRVSDVINVVVTAFGALHLTEPLGLTQPTVSHHLKVLVDAGLLHRDKRGVWAYFTLVPGALDSLADVLSGRVLAMPVG